MTASIRILTLAAGTLAALWALGAADTARSDDFKSYPGSACVKAAFPTVITSGAPPVASYYENGIFNGTTFDLTFVCPIIKDVNQTGNLRIDVSVLDNNEYRDIDCRVTSRNRSGTGGFTSGPARRYGTGTFNLTIPTTTGYAGGLIQLQCSVPGRGETGRKSAVLSYRVIESGTTE